MEEGEWRRENGGGRMKEGGLAFMFGAKILMRGTSPLKSGEGEENRQYARDHNAGCPVPRPSYSSLTGDASQPDLACPAGVLWGYRKRTLDI
jgi:hypothetical protein